VPQLLAVELFNHPNLDLGLQDSYDTLEGKRPEKKPGKARLFL